MWSKFFEAFLETLWMIVCPGFLATVLGGALGLGLFILRPDNLLKTGVHPVVYRLFSFCIDLMRALPFVILMIAVLPLTKWLVGRTIGTVAACVPLTLTAIPFMARVVENACAGVHPGLIEAGQSMGATPRQIVWRIVVPESQISILNGIILMLIALIGYSAMAGTLAGGGLGALAFNYGYQRFRNDIMLMTVLCMVVLVQGVQWLGDRWVSRLKVARQ